MYARLRRSRWRELVDDAVKCIYGLENRESGVTVDGLSAHLRLTHPATRSLIHTLTGHGLARLSHGVVRLTPAGRAMGLHLLRAHRLWERHLADNTGISLRDIHRIAERREHQMTKQEVRVLEARLGFPARDPHGDAIPDEAGMVPEPTTRIAPLTDWPIGIPGRIVHIEDEPEDLFTQLLTLGLLPGASVVIEESSPRGVRLRLDDEEDIWVAPILATQVEIGVREGEETVPRGCRLSDLKPGETARVLTLSPEIRGLLRRRLLDLGFTPGARVTPVLRSSFGRGDPTAYRIRGTVIALRKEQAAQVIVEPDPEQASTTSQERMTRNGKSLRNSEHPTAGDLPQS